MVESQNLLLLLMKQMDRLERSVESLDNKMDTGFEQIGQRLTTYKNEADDQINEIKIVQSQHNQHFKMARWLVTSGIFSIFTTIAAVVTVFITWSPHK